MGVVVGLNIGVAHLRLASGQIRRIERNVLDLAGLGNRGRVLRCALLEEVLQLRVGGVDRLAKVVG